MACSVARSGVAGWVIATRRLVRLLAALVITSGLACAAVPSWQKAKRIVFLGDSITFAGHYVSWVEAWMSMKHPDPERVVINLGLPSETVSGLSEGGHAGGRFPRPDLHERLDRVLEAARPDLVVACYGVNCGIYRGFDEERFRAFRKGMVTLRERVAEQGGEVLHLTPWPYDHSRGTIEAGDYNQAVLGRYAQWLLARRADGWKVIDLHGPMTAEMKSRRAEDPQFTFQGDGVHPNREGHWFGARVMIRALGGDQSAQAGDAGEMMKRFTGGAEALPLVEQRMQLLRDAWLSHTGHLRPGIRAGLPLAEAGRKAAEIAARIEAARLETK